MAARSAISGLYAVTPDLADTAQLVAMAAAAIAGGAALLQYRHKTAAPALRAEQARALAALCRSRGCLFIVNDDVELAIAAGADGAHVGRDDPDAGAARARLGPGRLLGVSCYNEIGRARAARAAGADYVAVGSMFASSVKPGAVHAPLGLIGEAHAVTGLPVVAIGGITLDNAPQLVAAGAAALAVISALFEAADITATARSFTALFAGRPQP
jgi:thiamine-phosphate pyrophosphorylase